MTRHFNAYPIRFARRGFTVVELLIVIVVVSILAGIVAIAYASVTTRAIEVSMKSDLQAAAAALEMDRRRSNQYPASAAESNGGEGLPASKGNTINYAAKPYGYCVSVTNPRVSQSLRLKASNTSKIEDGTCATAVSTLAGSGTSGLAEGAGASAQFASPTSVAVDSSGTVYVADRSNHRIRKVTPGGIVTTLAGSGTAGFADGPGDTARFNQPWGVAVDDAGTVYVADYVNHRIRKVTPSGDVTTLAGSGTGGFADGIGTSARFNQPRGVAVDATGTVYVADYSNDRIRKISPTGSVSTLAGSGTAGYAEGVGSAALFNRPSGVAVAAGGTVYVADELNHLIRQVAPGGAVTTLAGSGDYAFADGNGADAAFYSPTAIALGDDDIIYVADMNNHRIRTVSPSGVVSTLAGSGTPAFLDGSGDSAQFREPRGITVTHAGVVYVADYFNHRIRQIDQ